LVKEFEAFDTKEEADKLFNQRYVAEKTKPVWGTPGVTYDRERKKWIVGEYKE
jgi:hypothetical protein